MAKITPHAVDWPDQHHLDATTGWLMLGNAQEARVEFELISAAARRKPAVLEVEWRLLAVEKQWEAAVAVADAQVLVSPDGAAGWIHRSFALHELRRTQAARDLLLPAAERFPKDSTVPYNLACYECQLGNLAAARTWLRRALQKHQTGEARQERLAMAVGDPDLLALAAEIQRGDFAD